MPNLELPEETPIKAVPYPRGFEKQFERFLVQMVRDITTQFENQTIKKLNKSTVNKFEDQQVGNYANVFLGLSKAATRKIKKRYDDERISKNIKRTLLALSNENRRAFFSRVESQTGIDAQQLIQREGLTPQINALILETDQWAKRLRDDTLTEITANTLRVMATGARLEDVVSEFAQTAGKRRENAKFVARNQITTYNGLLNKIRYQKAGIRRAIWVTAQDERVRPSHVDRSGKEFDLDEGLFSSVDGKTLQAGQDFLCRCVAQPIIPEEEENNG